MTTFEAISIETLSTVTGGCCCGSSGAQQDPNTTADAGQPDQTGAAEGSLASQQPPQGATGQAMGGMRNFLPQLVSLLSQFMPQAAGNAGATQQ